MIPLKKFLFVLCILAHQLHQTIAISELQQAYGDDDVDAQLERGVAEVLQTYPMFRPGFKPEDLVEFFISQANVSQMTNEEKKRLIPIVLNKWCAESQSNWNGIGLNDRCHENMQTMICQMAEAVSPSPSSTTPNPNQPLTGAQLWLITYFDSFAKIPSGLLRGNRNWLGAYEECNDILVHVNNTKNELYDDDTLRGKHCKMAVTLKVNNGTCSNASLTVFYGFCAPHTCTGDDVEKLMMEFTPLIYNNSLVCLKVECPVLLPLYQDLWLVAVTMFLCAFSIPIIIGTIYDVFVHSPFMEKLPIKLSLLGAEQKQKLSKKYSGLTQREYYNQLPLYWRFALCFSFIANGKKILSFDRRPGTMECIHGLRVLSMTWVILGHSYLFYLRYIDNPRVVLAKLTKEFWFQGINNATVAVDTFFVMSAFLLTNFFMERAHSNKGRDFKSPRFWLMYYVHRYLRLTPAYMIIMTLSYTYWDYIGDGPMHLARDVYESTSTCASTWWQNALYIQNFWQLSPSCMSWSWYLANDMQFYWISPPLLVGLYYFPSITVGLITLLTAGSTFLRGYLNHHWGLPPTNVVTIDVTSWFRQDTEISNLIYVRPYTRIGTYFCGMIAAYIYFRFKHKIKLHWSAALLLWSFLFSVQLACLYAVWGWVHTGEWPTGYWWGVIYFAVNRNAWGATIGAVLVLCLTGNLGPINTLLSWRVWFPLSRLTYCAYLVQGYVIVYVYMTNQVEPHATHVAVVTSFFSNLLITYGLAFLLSVTFEAPLMNVEKLFLQPSGDTAKPKGR